MIISLNHGALETALPNVTATAMVFMIPLELLPQVIDWLARVLVPLSSELHDHPRLVVTQGDVYRRLQLTAIELLDVIMIDVDHSPEERLGEASVSFYTTHGLLAARQHLAADGVLAVWSHAKSSLFADALREVFEYVRIEPVTYDNCLIDQQPTDWLFLPAPPTSRYQKLVGTDRFLNGNEKPPLFKFPYV